MVDVGTSRTHYEVRQASNNLLVYKTVSRKKAKYVAISLALSSLSGSREVYKLMRDDITLMTYEPETAFASMQVLMRELVYDGYIKPTMPFVPDSFTDMAHSRVVKLSGTENGREKVQEKVLRHLDDYFDYVENNR